MSAVHGNWGTWSVWGTCSVTCGTGLVRRDRNCDNPYPSHDGNPCFGDPLNYNICNEQPCSSKAQEHSLKVILLLAFYFVATWPLSYSLELNSLKHDSFCHGYLISHLYTYTVSLLQAGRSGAPGARARLPVARG